MRIVSGTLKGRIIQVPSNFKLRPTTDLAKESLFNILNNLVDFEELKVLDLFSGTGSLCYEFASRGCPKITGIEKNFKHVSFINSTLKSLGIETVTIKKDDVFEFVSKCNETFDLIFADPPYDLPDLNKIPNAIFENNILKEDGILIIEHPKNINFSSHPKFQQQKSYGAVNFSFFEKSNN